jgi:hypothetical protein
MFVNLIPYNVYIKRIKLFDRIKLGSFRYAALWWHNDTLIKLNTVIAVILVENFL